MNITNKSPVIIDFIPMPKSVATLRFKLKGSKEKIKVDIDINMLYRDPSIKDRIFLLNPGMQNVYTNTDDRIYTLKFDIPEFKNNIISYIRMVIDRDDDKGDKYDNKCDTDNEVNIECMSMKIIQDGNNSEQVLISKEVKNTESDSTTNVSPIEIMSHQAAMVVPHTRPNSIKTSPWTLMTKRVL